MQLSAKIIADILFHDHQKSFCKYIFRKKLHSHTSLYLQSFRSRI